MKAFIAVLIHASIFFSIQAQSDFKYEYNVVNYHEINTQYSELSLIPFGDDEILVSDRGIKDKKNRWTGNAPFNLYSRSGNEPFTIMPSKLNSEFNDGPITTKDKTLMYVTTTNREGQIDPRTKMMVYRLNISKAELIDGKWQVTEIPELSDKRYSYAHPALSADGKTLYFVSDIPGGFGATDIYKCSVGDGSLTEPENLGPNVNTQYEEQFPFYHKDGYLFFSSRRKGGVGGLDIYFSHKINTHEWSEASIMGGDINTLAHESGIYLNDDLSAGYFTSNRIKGHGSDDIYLLTKKGTSSELLASIDNVKSIEKEANQVKEQVVKEEVLVENPVTKEQVEAKKQVVSKPEVITKKVTIEKPAIKKEVVEAPKLVKDKVLVEEKKVISAVKSKEVSKEPVEEQQIVEKKTPKIEQKVEREVVLKEKSVETLVKKPTPKVVEKEVAVIKKTVQEEKLEKAIEEKVVEKPAPKPIVKKQPIKKKSETVKETPFTILEQKIVEKKLNNAYFSSGSYAISSDSRALISDLAAILRQDIKAIIELHAHTDAKGDFESNAQLSEKRARAVMKALEAEGISTNRMRYLAYGETDLVIKTKEDAKLNRRVEFKIIDPNKNKGNVNANLFKSVRNNNVLEKGKFYVQVAAVNKSKIINRFNLKSYGVPTCYFEKGMYKYVLGPFNTFREANLKLKELEKTFPGTFIYLNMD